ncbi:MAG: sulfotransferase [Actinomycetota bacterium]|nr:sulfotransferase [Actinomycetota bacterium]
MAVVDLDAVTDAALAMADVSEPDLEPFRENLELLVDCVNVEANLTANGAVAAQAQLATALRNRIEVSAWTRDHAEIADEPIRHPLVLTGLPRSGTTYFQYLFDPEPSMRMLRHWEGQRPCPPPAFDPESADRRLAEANELAARMRSDPVHSEIAKIHLSDVDGPEECVAIMDQTFGNVGHYWTYRVPGYFERCLDTVDLRACYRHHKQVLQLLQWRGVPKRWVLKWPCHLVGLEALLEVYPDASFVITHRDPVRALASNCSLAALLRRGTSEPVDAHEIGRQMKHMIRVYLERLVEFDHRYGAQGRIAHVDYSTVVDRPEAVMAEVFETLRIELSPTFRDAIIAWRRDNPPGKRGTHAYSLADYGLDAAEVATDYAFYTERFAVPPEGRAL